MNRTLIFIIFGRVFQILISVIALKLMTNLLSNSEVAVSFLFLAIMNYFGLTLVNPVMQYLNRNLHQWKEEKKATSALLLFVIYLALISIIAFFFLVSFSTSFGHLVDYSVYKFALLMAATIFFNFWVMMVVPALNLLNYQKSFVLFTVSWLLLSLILSIVLILVLQRNASLWLGGQIISQLICGILSSLYLVKVLNEKDIVKGCKTIATKKNFKELFWFSLPLAVATLFMWVTIDGFRFVVEKVSGIEYLALLTVGFAVAQRISYAIEAIIQQVFFPTYYHRINTDIAEERSQAWGEMFEKVVPSYLITTFFIIALSPFLLTLLSGPRFYGAVAFVIFGAVFHLFRKLASLISISAHSERKTFLLIIPYAVGAFISVIPLFVPPLKNNFAIPAFLCLASVFVCLTMIMVLKKYCSYRFNFSLLLQSIALSLPFFFSVLLWTYAESLTSSFGIILIFGLYYLFVLWRVYKGFIKPDHECGTEEF